MAPSEHRDGLLLVEFTPITASDLQGELRVVMVDLENGVGTHQNGHCFVPCFWCLVCDSGKFCCAKNNQLTTAPSKQNLRDRLTVFRVPCVLCPVSCLVVSCRVLGGGVSHGRTSAK